MRRRRGNLLITVVVMILTTMMIATMLTLVTTQRLRALTRANNAGVTESYIALANICADAFKYDLESQYATYVVADVEHPEGIEISMSTYDDAIAKMQAALDGGATTEGGWKYKQSSPSLLVGYAGMTDTDFTKLEDDLLADARLSIVVNEPLEVTAFDEGDGIAFDTGDELSVSDIHYTVILEKGTTQIIQKYRLTGERLTVRLGGSVLSIHVSSNDARNLLESQSITRVNTAKQL